MNKKWKVIAIALLCTVAVLSTGFSVLTLRRLERLEANVNQVQHSVTSIDSDINSTLNSAITTITQTAEKGASIVADYSVAWGECSQSDQTMQVVVRIMPKEYNDQTQVRIRYSGYSAKGQGYDMVFDTQGFDEKTAQAVRAESGIYEANITIPLVDYISLSAEVQNDGVVRQEKLEDQYAAWGLKLLHPQMNGGFVSYSVSSTDKASIQYAAYASVNLLTSYDAGGVSNDPAMTSGSITMYLNGNEIVTKNLDETAETSPDEKDEKAARVTKSGDVYRVWSGDTNEYPTHWEGELKDLEDGDIATFVVRVQDENGFTYEREVGCTLFQVKDGWIQGTDSNSISDEILIK